MLRHNIKIFIIFLLITIFFILLKNGHIFDLGIIFRKSFIPNQVMNSLLNPSNQLEEDYKNLLVENNYLKTLEEENNKLKELLDFKGEEDILLEIGSIISRDNINNNILIINIGEDKGVEKGQAVVINNGIIIGKILEVHKDISKVRLLTDNFSKIAVQINNEDNISGIIKGSLGISMIMDYIPQEQDIKKGDLIITSDIGMSIPSGLIVGKVEEVEFSEEELFKYAFITPLVDYNTLGIIAVIIK